MSDAGGAAPGSSDARLREAAAVLHDAGIDATLELLAGGDVLAVAAPPSVLERVAERAAELKTRTGARFVTLDLPAARVSGETSAAVDGGGTVEPAT